MTTATLIEYRVVTVRLEGDPELGIAPVERRFTFADPDEAWACYLRAIVAGLDATAEVVRGRGRGVSED